MFLWLAGIFVTLLAVAAAVNAGTPVSFFAMGALIPLCGWLLEYRLNGR